MKVERGENGGGFKTFLKIRVAVVFPQILEILKFRSLKTLDSRNQ